MAHSESKAPSIFDFIDIVLFLSAHMEWRKKNEADFSMAKWAYEIGLGSKTILRFILHRRRAISKHTAGVLKTYFRFDQDEAAYFEALVSYSRAQSPQEKHSFSSTLAKLQRHREVPFEVPALLGVQDALGPVVLTVLTLQGMVHDAATIAEFLKLPRADVESALKSLCDSGLISLGADGAYRFEATSFKIPNQDRHSGLRRFHEYWIGRALETIDLSPDLRKFRSLKFALNPEEFTQACELINDFAVAVLARFRDRSAEGRRLYMIENVIFPISEAFRSRKQSTDTDLTY